MTAGLGISAGRGGDGKFAVFRGEAASRLETLTIEGPLEGRDHVDVDVRVVLVSCPCVSACTELSGIKYCQVKNFKLYPMVLSMHQYRGHISINWVLLDKSEGPDVGKPVETIQ